MPRPALPNSGSLTTLRETTSASVPLDGALSGLQRVDLGAARMSRSRESLLRVRTSCKQKRHSAEEECSAEEQALVGDALKARHQHGAIRLGGIVPHGDMLTDRVFRERGAGSGANLASDQVVSARRVLDT